MKISKIYILCILFLIYINYSFGQNNQDRNSILKKADSIRSIQQTSLKTDLLPEVLTTAINNGIVSTSGTSVTLNSTIFGLKKLFNPSVKIDTNYVKETFNRNFAFGGGIKIDSSNNINGFQASVKWAIKNNRDVSRIDDASLTKTLITLKDSMLKPTGILTTDIHTKITMPLEYAHRGINAFDQSIPKIHDSIYNKLLAALTKFSSSHNDSDFFNLQKIFLPYKNEVKIDTSVFPEYRQTKIVLIDSLSLVLENRTKKRGILTFGFNTDYKNKSWDSLSLKLEWIKGLGDGQKDSTKPWDLYAGAFYNFKTNTLTKKALQRQVFSGKIGINKVFATRRDGGPLFEAFGSAELDDILYGQNAGEKQYTLFADFIFTIKISQAVSIPLEIKYDPSNKGNLYGFLNLKWDILTSPTKSK